MTDGIVFIECHDTEAMWIRQCEEEAQEAWAAEFMKAMKEQEQFDA